MSSRFTPGSSASTHHSRSFSLTSMLGDHSAAKVGITPKLLVPPKNWLKRRSMSSCIRRIICHGEPPKTEAGPPQLLPPHGERLHPVSRRAGNRSSFRAIVIPPLCQVVGSLG